MRPTPFSTPIPTVGREAVQVMTPGPPHHEGPGEAELTD